jgi:membrane-associated phospholipid phosphatase
VPTRNDAVRLDAGNTPSSSNWRGLLCLHDAVTIGYFLIVLVVLARLPPSAARGSCVRTVGLGLAIAAAGVAAAHLVPGLPPLVRAIAYRAGLVGALGVSYVALREQLPIVRQVAYDDVLLGLDVAIFGVEPAVWLERINQRAVVEYFAFFYFNYYTICGSYMLVCTWLLPTDHRLTEFALGTLSLYFVAHLIYMLVPAYGPWIHLAGDYQRPVDGGLFWSIVYKAVTEGSPVKEIFPSMHTAGPTWLTLHAFRRAKTDRRWRVPAAISAFVAANIIFSTVFLRWHYVVDVFAGLALASLVAYLTPKVARWEDAWRARHGLGSPWPTSPWFSRGAPP